MNNKENNYIFYYKQKKTKNQMNFKCLSYYIIKKINIYFVKYNSVFKY